MREFDETGKQMAETYIAKGQAASNVMMGSFDERAQSLVAALDNAIKPIEQENTALSLQGSKKSNNWAC